MKENNNHVPRTTATLCSSWKCSSSGSHSPYQYRKDEKQGQKITMNAKALTNTPHTKRPAHSHQDCCSSITPQTAGVEETSGMVGFCVLCHPLHSNTVTLLVAVRKYLAKQTKEGRICFWLTIQGFSPSWQRKGTMAERGGSFLAFIYSQGAERYECWCPAHFPLFIQRPMPVRWFYSHSRWITLLYKSPLKQWTKSSNNGD